MFENCSEVDRKLLGVTNDLRIVKCCSSVHFRCLYKWKWHFCGACLLNGQNCLSRIGCSVDIAHKHCRYISPSGSVGGLHVFAH